MACTICICCDNCQYFSDSFGNQSFCDISGLAVSEGMRCLEESDNLDWVTEEDYRTYDDDF